MTDPTPRPAPIQFRDAAVERELAARVEPGLSLGQVAARDLARYYRLLALSRCGLHRLDLTRDELLAICDVSNVVLWTVDTAIWVYASVDDALYEGLADKWDIDGSALVEKLRHLDRAQAVALTDAVDRFWALMPDTTDYDAALRQVGLLGEED